MTDLADQIARLTPEQRRLLAMRLGRTARTNGDGDSPRTPRRDGERLPLSFTQEQLWFLDRLEPGNAAYNIPFALRLTGRLDTASLHEAVNLVVARHEPLRTVFVETDDGPRQVVRPSVHVPLAVVDLRELPPAERKAAVQHEAGEHAGLAFDLTEGPLVAVRLLALGDEDHLLLVNAHHIVFDASSAGIFSRDLAALYGERVTGQPAALPTITVAFADHVVRERQRLGDQALAAHLDHWRRHLDGAPSLSTLPPDRARPAVQTHRGASRELTLPADLTEQLSELARREAATLNAVMVTGLGAVLRRATGQDDLLLGMPVAGRSRTELESLVGSFANMLVLRLDVRGDVPVRELIRRTHREVSAAYAHQEVPYTRVVEEVRPRRDPGYNPLFQVMVSLGDGSDEGWSAAGVRFLPEQIESGKTDFDVFISLSREGGELRGTFQYNADLYLDETAEDATERLIAALREMVRDPGLTLQQIPVLRRGGVTVAATFTANLVRPPLQFWCDFLGLPFSVDLAPYAQVVQHLLAGPESDATIVLLRWEDALRHSDGDGATADALLDGFERDLRAAITGFRRRSAGPLVVAVCPPSPRFQEAAWLRRWAWLDDRLAVHCATIPDVLPVWMSDWQARYPVEEPFDAPADELGHVPYTSEEFAALGTVVARQLWRRLGSPARTVVVEAGPLSSPLPAPNAGQAVVSCRPGELLGELERLLEAGAVDPRSCVVLDQRPEIVAEVRDRFLGVVALRVPAGADARRTFLDHVWLLDEPAGDGVGACPMGSGRCALAAEWLRAPEVVAERARPAARVGRTEEQVVVPPRTPTEERLVVLWRHALRLDEVGVTNDFFALGGHSLLVTQLLSRIHAEFGRQLSLYTFFTHPTVEQLAAVLDEAADLPATHPVVPVPRGGDLLPSSTQERMWALDQMGEAGANHNTTYAAVLHGALDEGTLRQAVAELVRRHEALRATFQERRGRPVVVVRDELDCWLPTVDLCEVRPDERPGEVDGWVRRHATEPYDLAEGPLLRVRLLRGSPDEHYLLVGMHHAVCDNTSWDIFLSELAALYRSSTDGRAPSLPALPVQFADYAAWQRGHLAGDVLAGALDHWKRRLAGAPAQLDLPTDRPRPPVRSGRAGTSSTVLPAHVSASLRSFSRAEGVTPFTSLLAAYAAFLSRESGQTDVVLGVPTAGRSRPELDGVMGPFADILPLRLDLSGRPTFRRLVQRVHRAVLEARRHDMAPFATIVDALQVPRRPGRHPVFQCMFNFVDAPAQAFGLPGIEVVPVPVPSTGVDFDLMLNVSSQGDVIEADLEYSADLFTADGAGRLLAGLGRVLDEVLASPDEPMPTMGPKGAAGGAGETEPDVVVSLASGFDAGPVAEITDFWSERLGLRLRLAPVAPGQMLRPLLDATAGLGRAPGNLNVVLLRWEDGLRPGGEGSVPRLASAVFELEARLHELVFALEAFRSRATAPLLLFVCPPSPAFAPAPWTGVFGQLTDRLRQACAGWDELSVFAVDQCLDRFDAQDPQADAAAVVATLIAREAYRHQTAPVRRVVFDPTRLAAGDAAWRLIADQVERGRAVVCAVPAPAPAGETLGALGAVLRQDQEGTAADRLGRAVGEGTSPGPVLVLDPDPETLSTVARAHPGTIGVALPSQAGELRRFLDHLWLLDAPAIPSEAQAVPTLAGPEVLAQIAGQLDTAAGIRAASAPGAARPSQPTDDEPRTEKERTLARIWAELLEVDRVGTRDDFFDLGGESMTAIQAVALANEAGVAMTPRQLIERRTIAELCAAENGPAAPDRARAAEVEAVEGEAPVTSAQRWFLETLAPSMRHPGHFNHPYYLELTRPIPTARLEEAVNLLAAHHDALRLRLNGGGRMWRQRYAEPEGAVGFESHDLSALTPAERERAMERLTRAQQVGLDLARGPLMRVAHFRLGDGQRDRLLVVCHHLVTDGVSRGLILQDLTTLGLQLAAGQPPRLPDKTTSYGAWARRLHEHAQSEEVRAELTYWLEQAHAGPALPVDFPGGETTFATLDTVQAACTEAETSALREAARRLRVNVRDLLVWAAAGVVTHWTGQAACAIATTGHGREDLFEDVDVSRTVGWFQVIHPVRIELSTAGDGREAVAAVARALDGVPRNGIGYGLLRFACDDAGVREPLAALPQPEVAVNYMGGFSFDNTPEAASLFEVCQAAFGPPQDGTGRWPFRLDLAGSLVEGQLRLASNFGTQVYRRQTAEWFLDEVKRRLVTLAAPSRAPQDGITTMQTGGVSQWQ